jgi:hypothetical protein
MSSLSDIFSVVSLVLGGVLFVCLLICFVLFCFQAGSPSVVQAGLELLILLTEPPHTPEVSLF